MKAVSFFLNFTSHGVNSPALPPILLGLSKYLIISGLRIRTPRKKRIRIRPSRKKPDHRETTWIRIRPNIALIKCTLYFPAIKKEKPDLREATWIRIRPSFELIEFILNFFFRYNIKNEK